MNHDELKKDINARIDRMEVSLTGRLDSVHNRLDELVPTVVKLTTENKVRLDSQAGQIKLIWTFIIALIGAVGTYLTKKLGLS